MLIYSQDKLDGQFVEVTRLSSSFEQLIQFSIEEDTGIESRWGKCLIIGLIRTLKFSTFVFFVGFLCFFFAFQS
jgi:hypothetical protein